MYIGKVAESPVYNSATTAKPASQETQRKDTTLAADNTDKFVKSEVTYAPAYTKETYNSKTVKNNSKNSPADKNEKQEQLRSFVHKMILTQAKEKAPHQIRLNQTKENSDFWSGRQTAERIFGFVLALAQSDNTMLEPLRNAFEDGFNIAERDYGGKDSLPDECYVTKGIVDGFFILWERQLTKNP
jgi:hypothetical protein